MDDHDLGALLDASVPTAAASDETLARIRGRSAQRRRRAAASSAALTVAVVAVAALGVSWVGGSSKQVTPGGTSSSVPSGTTTIVPDGRCFPGDVSLRIDARSTTFDQITQWAVYADNRSDTACRVSAPIKATIHDSNGRILTAVSGTLTAAVVPDKPGYVSELAPDTSTLVGQLVWTLPCSNGPVELEVAGFSPSPARLALPRQACVAGIDRSYFHIVPVGDTVGGETCPFGSLTLAIDPHAVRINAITRWAVTATTRTGVLCRTHAGLSATIEHADGTVLGSVTGNPAAQDTMAWQDLFPPRRAQFAGYLSWTNPCSDGPVRLVVRFEDRSYGAPATLDLPKQTCTQTNPGPSHFQIDLGIPAVNRSAGTTTTAKP